MNTSKVSNPSEPSLQMNLKQGPIRFSCLLFIQIMSETWKADSAKTIHQKQTNKSNEQKNNAISKAHWGLLGYPVFF